MRNRSFTAIPVVLAMAALVVLLLAVIGCSKQTKTQSAVIQTQKIKLPTETEVTLVDLGQEQLIPAKIGPSERASDFSRVRFLDEDVMRRFATTCVGIFDKGKGRARLYSVWGATNGGGDMKALEIRPEGESFTADSDNLIRLCRDHVPDVTTETWQGRGSLGEYRVSSLAEAAKCLKDAGEFGIILRGKSADKFWLKSMRFPGNIAPALRWPSIMICQGERILRVKENESSSFFTRTEGRWEGRGKYTSVEVGSWAGVIDIIYCEGDGSHWGFYGYLPDEIGLSAYGLEFRQWLKKSFISKPLGNDDYDLDFSQFKEGEGVTVKCLDDENVATIEGRYQSYTEWVREAAIGGVPLSFAVYVTDRGTIDRNSQVMVKIRNHAISGKVIAVTKRGGNGGVFTIKPNP